MILLAITLQAAVHIHYRVKHAWLAFALDYSQQQLLAAAKQLQT